MRSNWARTPEGDLVVVGAAARPPGSRATLVFTRRVWTVGHVPAVYVGSLRFRAQRDSAPWLIDVTSAFHSSSCSTARMPYRCDDLRGDATKTAIDECDDDRVIGAFGQPPR